MKLIICDKCKREFELEPQVEKKGNIERIYLKCPRCRAEYTAFYMDKGIRFKQDTIRDMQMNSARERDPQKKRVMLDAIQKLKNEIGNDMNRLKIEIEG